MSRCKVGLRRVLYYIDSKFTFTIHVHSTQYTVVIWAKIVAVPVILETVGSPSLSPPLRFICFGWEFVRMIFSVKCWSIER